MGFPCSLSNGYLKSQKHNWKKLKRRKREGGGGVALGKYYVYVGKWSQLEQDYLVNMLGIWFHLCFLLCTSGALGWHPLEPWHLQ